MYVGDGVGICVGAFDGGSEGNGVGLPGEYVGRGEGFEVGSGVGDPGE